MKESYIEGLAAYAPGDEEDRSKTAFLPSGPQGRTAHLARIFFWFFRISFWLPRIWSSLR